MVHGTLVDDGLNTFMVVMGLGVLVMAANCYLSLRTFRQPPRPSPQRKDNAGAPIKVSVLVPARNEAARIVPCLESLLAQTQPGMEILVLDDQSTDGTAELVSSLPGAGGRKPRVVIGKPLPEHWVGKSWALHQLSLEAQGEILLFADADTRMEPEAVASAVAAMESGEDFLSFWPRQETRTWSEVLVVSLLPVLLLWLRPHWLERCWKLPALGMANGQFIAVRKTTYAAIGGHEAIRSHLVDDVALARLARRKGISSVNYDGTDLVHCRMYDSFDAVWEGFTKNMRAAFGGHWWAFTLFGAITLLALLGPYLPWPWILDASRQTHRMLCVGLIACITLVRTALCLQFRTPIRAALFHPVGVLLMFCISVNSWWKLSSTGVAWKGRIYRQ